MSAAQQAEVDQLALERAWERILGHWKACLVAGHGHMAAEWEAILVASGFGSPRRMDRPSPPRPSPDDADLAAGWLAQLEVLDLEVEAQLLHQGRCIARLPWVRNADALVQNIQAVLSDRARLKRGR